MVKLEPKGSFIFHITHIENIPSVIAQNGLVCDSTALQNRMGYVKIGYDHIKQRRIGKRIPCFDSNINVGDCVPFYFGVRMPMLFVITRKNQELAYNGPAREIVYLVADIASILQSDLKWCFTDANAACEIAKFYNNPEDFDKLDWSAIEKDRWGKRDNPNDPNLIERKQAEFLVHSFFPWKYIKGIAVHDEAILERLQKLLSPEDLQRIRTCVQNRWYYD